MNPGPGLHAGPLVHNPPLSLTPLPPSASSFQRQEAASLDALRRARQVSTHSVCPCRLEINTCMLSCDIASLCCVSLILTAAWEREVPSGQAALGQMSLKDEAELRGRRPGLPSTTSAELGLASPWSAGPCPWHWQDAPHCLWLFLESQPCRLSHPRRVSGGCPGDPCRLECA